MAHNINTIIIKIIITGHETSCRNDFTQLIIRKKCICGDDNQTYHRLFKISDSLYIKAIIYNIKNININMEYMNESDCLLYFVDENVNFLNDEDEKTLINIHNKNSSISKYLVINKISEKKRNDSEYILYLKKIMASCKTITCCEVTNDIIEMEKLFNTIMKHNIDKRNENNIKFKANYITFPFNIVPVTNIDKKNDIIVASDDKKNNSQDECEEVVCIDEKNTSTIRQNIIVNESDISPSVEIKKQQPERDNHAMHFKSINELEIKDEYRNGQIIINLPQIKEDHDENEDRTCCCFW